MPPIQRFLSQATQDALLKFAPQRTALSEALQAARENYGQTVHAGNVTAQLTQQATRRAIPQISSIYSKANAAGQKGATLMNADLANLPGVANQYKADQAGEVAQQLATLLGSRSRDEAMLVNEGTQARAGAQFNEQNARMALQKTLSGLLSKSNATAQEQGSFAATEAEKLAHEAEDLEQRERSSQRTAGSAREGHQITRKDTEENNRTRRETAAGKGSAGPKMTASENAKASSTLHEILNTAKGLATSGRNRAELVEVLTNGRPSASIGINEHGKPVKEGEKAVKHITLSAVKPYSPDVVMSAALDLALGGEISRNTQHRLEAAGYNLEQLGVRPSRGRYPAPPPRPISPGIHRRPA